MAKVARGDRTPVPLRLAYHLVAAAYGQDPETVKAWPADTFMDAVGFLAATTPQRIRSDG